MLLETKTVQNLVSDAFMQQVKNMEFNIIMQKDRWHIQSAPSSAKRDPYEVLGVKKNATASEIKKAYYAVSYHAVERKQGW